MADQPPLPYNWNMWNNTLSPDYPTLGTQGTATPNFQRPRTTYEDVYRPYPVNMQYRPYGSTPYGPTPSLSQIREDNDQFLREIMEQTPDENARHPYTAKEMEKLFEVWVVALEDPIVGTQQTQKVFWDRVTETYYDMRQEGSPRRNLKMLRGHFDRVSREIQKFSGIFINEERRRGSGMSEADIMRSAMMIYQQDTGRAFKYVNTWNRVRQVDSGRVPHPV